MPDWNPDREGHTKHKYVVMNATTQPIEGVPTSKGLLKFNDQGRMLVNDPALAHEIRTSEIGKRDVTVTRLRYPDAADRGHRYHFGQMPAMPWHVCEVCGKKNSECKGIHPQEIKQHGEIN